MINLELRLLPSQMVVQDDLLFKVAKHLVAHSVCFIDAVRDGLVTHLEMPDLVSLCLQVSLGKQAFDL